MCVSILSELTIVLERTVRCGDVCAFTALLWLMSVAEITETVRDGEHARARVAVGKVLVRGHSLMSVAILSVMSVYFDGDG